MGTVPPWGHISSMVPSRFTERSFRGANRASPIRTLAKSSRTVSKFRAVPTAPHCEKIVVLPFISFLFGPQQPSWHPSMNCPFKDSARIVQTMWNRYALLFWVDVEKQWSDMVVVVLCIAGRNLLTLPVSCQVITFSSPLTVILGDNDSGK